VGNKVIDIFGFLTIIDYPINFDVKSVKRPDVPPVIALFRINPW